MGYFIFRNKFDNGIIKTSLINPVPITCDRSAATFSPLANLSATVSLSSAVNSSATYLKLGNGVTLVHQEMPTASVASVDIWVKAGASNDPDAVLGMAHFLEHMIFKGTEAIAAGEFDLVIESEGGVSNAATSLDYAHYNFTVAASRFAITLPYLAQMLLKARIDEEDLEQERLVVLEELRQAMDDPDWCAYQHLMETAYDLYPSSHPSSHPYVRSVLGNEATINEITADQMREYHRSHYRPENMTIAIAGAVTREEAIEVVNAAFNNDAFARNNFLQDNRKMNVACKNVEPKSVALKPDYCKNRRDIISLPNVQHSRLNIAWIAASVANLEEAIQLELVATLLTEGRSSRLIQDLLEGSGLVQDITSSFALQQEAGLFTISAYLEAENLQLVEDRIMQQVINFINHQVSEVELNRSKRSLCNHFTFALESPSQLANFLGYHSLLGCEDLCRDWSTAYSDIIKKVEPKDLQFLAKKYLNPDKCIVTAVLKK
jgi:predicted Zn-dependent peptidase